MTAAPRAAALAVALAASLAASLTPAAARAEDGPRRIRWDAEVSGVLTSLAFVTWFGSEFIKDDLAPSSCRFCGPNKLDKEARDALRWDDIDAASRASDVFALALVPAVAGHQFLAARGAGGNMRDGLVDVLVVAEAVAVAGTLNQVVKFAVGRQRPFVHFGNHEPDRAPESTDNLSFYSGHTSAAFAVVAAAGTVSSLRGYRSAPWVWGAGVTIASGVGFLRIAGDKHYLSDVLVGAAAGTAIGIALPRLLHPREDEEDDAGDVGPRVSFVPLPLGVHVTF